MIELVLESGDKIISKTDVNGTILKGNDTFYKFAEYKENEILGKPHNIVRHPDMPRIAFRLLWAKILDKQTVNAFVKNRSKNGKFYWVYATVSPTLNPKTNEIDSFYSIRKKPNREAVEQLEGVYKVLKEIEESKGYEETREFLRSFLAVNGMKWNDLMQRLQAQGVKLKLP